MVKIVESMQKAWKKLELLFSSFFNVNRLLIKVSMLITDSILCECYFFRVTIRWEISFGIEFMFKISMHLPNVSADICYYLSVRLALNIL